MMTNKPRNRSHPIIRAWPLIPVLLLFIVPCLSPYLRTERSIATEGAIYQIIGIAVVVLGLDQKLKHFTGISIIGGVIRWCRDIWAWIKSIWPWRKPKHVNISGSASGSGSAFGRATVTQQINHLSVAEQLDWLHKKLDNLASNVDENDFRIQDQIKTMDQKMSSIEASISAKIAEFNEKLGKFMIGSFKWELVGTFALAVGVLFGTIPWWVSRIYGGQ